MNTVTTSELDKALALAELGFDVVACRHEDEGNAPRKSPYGGPYVHTTDADEIRKWWARHPNALAGVATGRGYVVVDVDVKHGKDGFKALRDLGNDLPPTFEYVSPSGGKHYVYRSDGTVGNVRLPGVEVQGLGTVAVWYGDVPDLAAIAPAPAWALSTGTPTKPAEPADVERYLSQLEGVPTRPHVEAALQEALSMEGDHSDLWEKVFLVGKAVLGRPEARMGWNPHGGADVFEALHDALEPGYEAKYDATKWADEWNRALSAVFGWYDQKAEAFEEEAALQAEWTLGWLDSPEFEAELAALTAEEAPSEEAAPEEDAAPFRIVTRAELRARPKPEWIISGLLQGSGVIVLAGEGGLGKSFLALDWAACIATGREWDGSKVRHGKALYVAAEGVEFFDARLTAWEKFNRVDVPDDRLMYVDEGFSLSDDRAVEHMRKIVEREELDFIVLDTLSQLSEVENENDNAQLSRVLRQAKAIREVRPGASVLIVHHVSKGERGRVRGAGAIRNNADAVIVARARGGDTFSLSTRVEDDGKQKNATAAVLHGFTLTDFAGAAVVTREAPEDNFDRAIREVLSDGEAHPIADFLVAANETDEAASKALRRRLGKTPGVVREGERQTTRWRRLDT